MIKENDEIAIVKREADHSQRKEIQVAPTTTIKLENYF